MKTKILKKILPLIIALFLFSSIVSANIVVDEPSFWSSLFYTPQMIVASDETKLLEPMHITLVARSSSGQIGNTCEGSVRLFRDGNIAFNSDTICNGDCRFDNTYLGFPSIRFVVPPKIEGTYKIQTWFSCANGVSELETKTITVKDSCTAECSVGDQKCDGNKRLRCSAKTVGACETWNEWQICNENQVCKGVGITECEEKAVTCGGSAEGSTKNFHCKDDNLYIDVCKKGDWVETLDDECSYGCKSGKCQPKPEDKSEAEDEDKPEDDKDDDISDTDTPSPIICGDYKCDATETADKCPSDCKAIVDTPVDDDDNTLLIVISSIVVVTIALGLLPILKRKKKK